MKRELVRMRYSVIAILPFLYACSSDPASSPGADAAAPVTDAGSTSTQDAHVASGNDASGADTAVADASIDAAIADADAAPAPTCGDPPARFTLLSGADNGLARDNVTMLVWMRESQGAGEPPQTQAMAKTYCSGRTMRLPTKDEALALADQYTACAFGHWGTWTSTDAPAAGYAWVVDYTGGSSPQVADNFPSAVLCVRDK